MAIVLLLFVVTLGMVGERLLFDLSERLSVFFSLEDYGDLSMLLAGSLKGILLLLSGLLVIAAVVGVLVGALQTGFLFAPKALKLDFGRLNPVEGFKRMFSLRSIVELLKATLKVGVVGFVAYQVLKDRWKDLVRYSDMEVTEAFSDLWKLLYDISLRCGIALLVLAIFDYFYQRWEYEKNIRMTRQELKDELKEVEGNPEVRRRQRRMMYDILRRRMMEEVPKADVVITNPTHFAVALKYDPDTMSAPTVVAKGVDHIALKIIELAREHGVPIFRNPELARELYYKVNIGEEIPIEFYRIVAEILVRVYSKKG